MIQLYRFEQLPIGRAAPLPGEFELRQWRTQDGFPGLGRHFPANVVWWAFAKCGLFARRGFCELSIRHRGRTVHRLIVTPRWHRFPFMAERDLQIGGLWTHPAFRRRGLARCAIEIALDLASADAGAIWYVTETGNLASIALAEDAGMRLAAVGQRTRPLGIALLGQFRLRGAA